MVGRSYGYTAPSEDPAEVLDTIMEAADAVGCADRISLSLDCASSEMYDSSTGTYLLKGQRVTSDELIDYVQSHLGRKRFRGYKVEGIDIQIVCRPSKTR